MKKTITFKGALTAAAAGAFLVLMPGCMFDKGEDGPTAEEKQQAQELAATATDGLSSTFTNMSSGEFAYGKTNWPGLEESYTDFEGAKALDPGNSEAKFGAALTGMMMAVQAENISTLLDEAEVGSPFDPVMAREIPNLRVTMMKKAAEGTAFPEFHEFQDAIADSVLPRLDQAIQDLSDVYADVNFSLTVTIDGEAREIDRAEVGLLLAGFKTLRALVTMPLAYDIDIDQLGSYDFIETISGIGDIQDFSTLTPEQEAALNHVTSLLTPGSLFLTARPDYATRLSKVDDELIEAVELVKDVLTQVGTETDDQQDDILKLCAGAISTECINPDERDDALDALDSVLKYIGGPVDIYVEDLDTTLTLNPSIILGKVQDFKKFLPSYGFYTSSEWSEEKPVIYFTDNAGNMTGSLKDLADIFNEADSLGLAVEDVIARVRQIVKLQDPTFQGFFHNGTENSFWGLVLKVINSGNQTAEDVTIGLMEPQFVLNVLAKK